MKNKEEVFKTHCDIINDINKALLERKNQIIKNAKNKDVYPVSVEAVFIQNSIELYCDYLSFFSNQIKNNQDNEKYFIFLSPNIRILFDIYSRFLYLFAERKDLNDRVFVCSVYQIITYKHMGKDDTKNYSSIFDDFKKFALQNNIVIPDEISKNWAKNNDFVFPQSNIILTEDNIDKFSQKTKEIFSSGDIYIKYKHFSEMLHGNPYYFNNQTSLSTEIFHIIVFALMISLLLIEIIDDSVLHKTGARDFREIVNKIKKDKESLVDLWLFSKKGK